MARPHVLVGACSGRRVARLERLGWGRLHSIYPVGGRIGRKFQPYDGERWAFDNGAFAFWNAKLEYNFDRFVEAMNWLDQEIVVHNRRVPPVFAVVPDLPMRGRESLEFSKLWLRKTREIMGGWQHTDWYREGRLRFWMPWYLAVQDGMTPADLEEPYDGVPLICYFEGIFIGGSDEFKATAPEWRKLLNYWSGKLHFARASSVRRLDQAIAAGANSVDSTQMMWSEEKFIRFAKAWCQRVGHEVPDLTLEEAA